MDEVYELVTYSRRESVDKVIEFRGRPVDYEAAADVLEAHEGPSKWNRQIAREIVNAALGREGDA